MTTIDADAVIADAEFELDVQVVPDVLPERNARCSTNDGCAPTCASSCLSKV